VALDVIKHNRAVLWVFAVLVVLAGCGDDEGSPTAAGSGGGEAATTVGACSAQTDACGAPSEVTVAVGSPAPALAGAALDGSGDVDLDSMLGKPTVVVLWSPPCPHCQEQMPKIDALSQQLGTKVDFMSAAIVLPDVEAPPGYTTPAEAVATMKLTMPSVAISRDVADATWRPEAFPTAYLLDQDHNVVQVIQSADAGAIASALSSQLGVA